MNFVSENGGYYQTHHIDLYNHAHTEHGEISVIVQYLGLTVFPLTLNDHNFYTKNNI